ncbi:GP-16 [Rachiplusia nu nucleopolyhedrovirus]|uniref:GP-16 n=1 Tax=Rachiplusia nu nucleopolyhedrovirus TaxID=2605775 RepID=A0AAE6M6E4_9ABAC|nr:GP-16 [Rachiplusia nu nucleopolyhedrovirus]QEI03698.1 GP-16 [Rachiplusia nu nucleopolyhedrovirus]
MNYSTVALFVLLAYLWQTGNLMHEVEAIKKFLHVMYETIEYRFDTLVEDLALLRRDTLLLLHRIQNTTRETYDMVISNGNKIDYINNKLDNLLIK